MLFLRDLDDHLGEALSGTSVALDYLLLGEHEIVTIEINHFGASRCALEVLLHLELDFLLRLVPFIEVFVGTDDALLPRHKRSHQPPAGPGPARALVFEEPVVQIVRKHERGEG